VDRICRRLHRHGGAARLRHRPERAPAAVLKTPKAEAKERAAASGEKKKLSFKHKHALETLPGRIDEMGQKRALIQSKLEAPDLYARDRSAFDKLSQQLLDTEKKIASMEEEWLELEAMRESVEG
jgi:ATP-binding cassette subfamily F protein uup